jgi:hypothetical protein
MHRIQKYTCISLACVNLSHLFVSSASANLDFVSRLVKRPYLYTWLSCRFFLQQIYGDCCKIYSLDVHQLDTTFCVEVLQIGRVVIVVALKLTLNHKLLFSD